jgi:nucleotide-binding universal stress UspA family protein
MAYSNIVVGLDHSEYSEAALIESSHWVKKHGGKLSVVHAVYYDHEEFGYAPSILEQRMKVGTDRCEDVVKKYKDEFGIEIDYVVREGEAHEVIVQEAEERKADLIAMGTFGRRGLKRMIMGSVTAGVILDAPCDVLVVKKPCEKCTGKYDSILLPYDGSEQSKNALNKTLELKKGDPDVMITLLYVIPRYEEMLGFFKTNTIEERLFSEAGKIVLEGEKLALADGHTISTIVEQGAPFEKICDISKGLGVDLIVMGSHGWRGVSKAILGSTAERVITHSTVPVLVTR